MPDRNDDSENPSTLPRPELNPLINPLLAENMGRWASVYYTSPPERRQEAVLELLRELEREQGHGESSAELAAEEIYPARDHLIDTPPPAPPRPMYCRQCGHENTANQKFCGMCGVPLLATAGTEPPSLHPAEFEPRAPEPQAPELRAPEFRSPESPLNRWPLDAGDLHWNAPPEPLPELVAEPEVIAELAPPPVPDPAPEEQFVTELPPGSAELPPLPSYGQDSYGQSSYGQDRSHEYERPLSFLQQQPEEPRSYYRLYIGSALAVLILVLGYVAWRNTQNSSATAQLAPQTPPAVEQPAESTPTQPAPSVAKPYVNNAEKTAPPKTTAEAPRPAKAPPRAEPAPARPNPAAIIAKEQPKKSPPPPASAVGGSQELAVAQEYLNGTNGQQRNSSEAAQWLWKSVEKRNTTATILLSDLYLKGNGVPKNCDQAHVLLDAAAARGVRDAVDRLRNLKAYGCE